jgi:hypothetical protein
MVEQGELALSDRPWSDFERESFSIMWVDFMRQLLAYY